MGEHFLSQAEFEKLPEEEKIEIACKSIGKSAPDVFKDATHLNFSYTTMVGILRRYGIVREKDEWRKAVITDCKSEKQTFTIEDFDYAVGGRKTFSLSLEAIAFLNDIECIMSQSQIVNFALRRLQEQVENNEVDIHLNMGDLLASKRSSKE